MTDEDIEPGVVLQPATVAALLRLESRHVELPDIRSQAVVSQAGPGAVSDASSGRLLAALPVL